MNPTLKPRLSLIAGALALALGAADSSAVTLTVTSAADSLAAVPPGSLREKIGIASNDCGCTGAPYTINFAFSGLTNIALLTPLIVSGNCAITIDGYDQTPVPATGAAPNSIASIRSGTNATPKIVINAASVSGAALILQAPGTVVKGLVFQNHGTSAIQVQAPGAVIVGNHIGTNDTATACVGAGVNGIGVELTGGANGAIVGGINPADRNVIGCHVAQGIYTTAASGVFGNLIGTGAGGVALPNATGILADALFSPGPINIGQSTAGFGNLIARNSGIGVAVCTSSFCNLSQVNIRGNDIFLNGALGIDLGSNGPTADSPSTFPVFGSPNNGVNKPKPTFVRFDGTNTAIDWAYQGFSNSTVLVDFYSNPAGLGLDEGAQWTGTSVSTGTGGGSVTGTTTLAGTVLFPSAAATVGTSGTGEFSAAVPIDVTPKSLSFSTFFGTPSAPQTVTFTNTGSTPATLGPPVTQSQFVATSSTCTAATPVPAGGSCTTSVTFNPTIFATATDSLDMPVAGGAGVGIKLTGLALPNPIAAASPTAVNFGSSLVGTPSAPVTVTLSNSGNDIFTVSNVALTGAAASSYSIVSNGCAGATVGTPLGTPPPGVTPVPSCAIQVRMTPAAAGSLAGSLDVATNATNPSLSVPLTGVGTPLVVPKGTVVAAPASPISFGSARIGATSAPVTLSISNGGAPGTAFTVSNVQVRGTGFKVLGDGCTGTTVGSSIPTCTVTFAFQPTAVGTYRIPVDVTSDATNPLLSLEFTGTGTAPPSGIITPSPSLAAFGVQALGVTTLPQTVQYTNTGTLPVTVTGLRFTGTTDYAQTNDCKTLDVGNSCRALVTFTPTSIGDRSGNLVMDSDASNGPIIVTVTGTGSPAPVAAVDLSPSAISFGAGVQGSASGTQTIKLTNSGGATLSLTRLYAVGDFRLSPSCPATLPPNGSCTLLVSFVPSIPGTRTGKVVVESNAAAGPAEATLSGNGCRSFALGGSRLTTTGVVCK